MKNTSTSVFSNKLLLLLCLCWISITQSSCLTNYYSPSGTASFSGTTAYCQGATATANTLTYNQCTLGGGIINTGVNYTAQWYYNTTGGTSIPGSTAYGGPMGGTSPTSGPGTISYTPATGTPGTYYYFCYMSWTATGTCTSDFTSTPQMITVTAAPAALSGTPSVCIGETTTLASTTSGGVWSSSNPAIATVAGGVVTGVAAGTATISYSISGCPATRLVTVYAAPSAITPATPVVVCQGATTPLANSASPGTWTSSNVAVATVNSSGMVSGITGGTATITYTLNATGCFVTKPITVNPIPGPITGTLSLCPSTTTPLFNSGTGGTWSSSTPAVATINPVTGVVSGVTTGTTIISYSGCGAVGAVVTVHPLPAAITGTMAVCENAGTTTLSSATPGGTWSSSTPANAVAGLSTGVITGVSDGTATITYTSPLTCITTSVVTVKPIPEAITGVVPICAGQSMTLANAIPGGSWISGTPGMATIDASTGFLTALVGGVVSISYFNECASISTLVTISPSPAPIEGRDVICLGRTTALANSTLGGTWSSSNPTVASVPVGSGLVTGVAVGPTIITYMMPGGCYATIPVEVVNMPPAITGTTKACPNTTTVLSNATTGGTWISGSPSVATIGLTSGVVTGVAASTANITYTTADGCPDYTVITINPLPEPIIGGDFTYCAADIDTLYSASPGGTWTSLTPSIVSVGATTGIVEVVNGGIATVRYTLPTGCSISKTFSAYPPPGPNVTYLAATNTFYTDTGYSSYQWYDSVQGPIPGATTYRTAALYYGFYYVRVTDDNDCSGKSANHPYNAHTGTTDPLSEGVSFHVFPNPSQGSIYIEAPINVRAVVTSVDGKVLISQQNAKHINISSLAAGLYMVMLYDDTGVQRSVHKLIKQ